MTAKNKQKQEQGFDAEYAKGGKFRKVKAMASGGGCAASDG